MNGFVIIQIGDEELDRIYEEAIAPAIQECEFDPKRVDRDNQGGLLKSEIIDYIRESGIIVADLTNERPNCYLEIGYAMGLDRNRELILTVRQDHFLDHPDHVVGGLIGLLDLLVGGRDTFRTYRIEIERDSSDPCDILIANCPADHTVSDNPRLWRIDRREQVANSRSRPSRRISCNMRAASGAISGGTSTCSSVCVPSGLTRTRGRVVGLD